MPDEKQVSPDQQKFFAATIHAVARAQLYAEEANKLGLPILAREWSFVGRCLEERVQMQLRALRGEEIWKSPDPAVVVPEKGTSE